MSKIVFFTWPGGGNQPPAIGLAQQLRRHGHETIIAGYTDQASRFEALDLEFATLTRSGAALAGLRPGRPDATPGRPHLGLPAPRR